ncbi:YutD family protein [Streptococcus pseudoporcinus]|uniref:Transcriptional regulator n=1 Tax=Streptococcus pseudoporcinus TaxID=361101 RepID=A0A4U9XKD0_9STRE|nr:YutD family protein [Streptococcus pseudoporcinus]VTS12731.1 transcriptional regulator [Streptococcus pseudoporcinus]VUC65463.1 transcriptional regulator [Streptococcus pseudoporcinus]VUC96380.1 transcriptional regulator [Streptococcus pseudoporcinus]VUC96774.1 transcriptional regulator [Streptococcus pseudoporcinus]
MKKEISPEMYNYNKFPGPEFIAFDKIVKSDQLEFFLIENEKDAFNATAFSQRFTEILLKYDYIVGDWGNEQLRLKGFYKDSNEVKKSNRISRLEDYIKEFCSFGCAYFVLENSQPVEIKFEEERSPRRRKNHRSNHRKRRQVKENVNARPKPKEKGVEKEKAFQKASGRKRKDSAKTASKKNDSKQTRVREASNDHFIIRKKDK